MKVKHHLILAGLALAVILPLVSLSNLPANVSEFGKKIELIDINISHLEPAQVRLEYARNLTSSWLRLKNESTGKINFTVPSSWQRSEVRGVPIEDIKFRAHNKKTEWVIPGNSSVSFIITESPRHLVLHHTSASVLKLTHVQADITTEEKTGDTLLISNEPVQLW